MRLENAGHLYHFPLLLLLLLGMVEMNNSKRDKYYTHGNELTMRKKMYIKKEN